MRHGVLGANEMIAKARENLECASVLALDQYAYYDAVANRAYYAAYHAAWHYLTQTGHTVPTTVEGRTGPIARYRTYLKMLVPVPTRTGMATGTTCGTSA